MHWTRMRCAVRLDWQKYSTILPKFLHKIGPSKLMATALSSLNWTQFVWIWILNLKPFPIKFAVFSVWFQIEAMNRSNVQRHHEENDKLFKILRIWWALFPQLPPSTGHQTKMWKKTVHQTKSVGLKWSGFDLIFSLIQIWFNYNIKSKNTHFTKSLWASSVFYRCACSPSSSS